MLILPALLAYQEGQQTCRHIGELLCVFFFILWRHIVLFVNVPEHNIMEVFDVEFLSERLTRSLSQLLNLQLPDLGIIFNNRPYLWSSSRYHASMQWWYLAAATFCFFHPAKQRSAIVDCYNSIYTTQCNSPPPITNATQQKMAYLMSFSVFTCVPVPAHMPRPPCSLG